GVDLVRGAVGGRQDVGVQESTGTGDDDGPLVDRRVQRVLGQLEGRPPAGAGQHLDVVGTERAVAGGVDLLAPGGPDDEDGRARGEVEDLAREDVEGADAVDGRPARPAEGQGGDEADTQAGVGGRAGADGHAVAVGGAQPGGPEDLGDERGQALGVAAVVGAAGADQHPGVVVVEGDRTAGGGVDAQGSHGTQ